MTDRSAAEKGRLEALKALNILDTPRQETFDRITRFTSKMLGVPIALISFVDEDRQWFKSSFGLDATESPRENSFCSYAILQDGIFLVEDASTDDRFKNNPFVTGSPNIRTYAGRPLLASGEKIGTLCVIYDEVHSLSSDDLELLDTIGGMLEDALSVRAKARQLELNIADLERQKADHLSGKMLLESMAKTVNVGAWEVDLLNGKVTWSGETRRIHGVPADYDPNLEDAMSFYPGAERERIGKLFSTCAENGQPYEAELQFVTAQGEKKWVRTIGNPVCSQGKIIKVVGAFQDITQEVARRDELVRERQRADEANYAKSKFLATMSHEIRTPLNGIMGMLQVMHHAKLPDPHCAHVDIAYQSAQTLTKLLSDILDYSKIEAGEVDMMAEPFRPDEPAERAKVLFDSLAREKGLELQFNASAAAPVLGDVDRMSQVLNNLVSNALKFTAQGKVTITVSSRIANSGLSCLRYEVRDTGIGIPEEKSISFSAVSRNSTVHRGGITAVPGLASPFPRNWSNGWAGILAWKTMMVLARVSGLNCHCLLQTCRPRP